MSKIRKCAGCGAEMDFSGEEQIQLGQTGFLLGSLSNLLSGSLDVEIWVCPACGKIEFYRQGSSGVGEYEEGHMPQVICCKCGTKHDLDDPKCPGCGLKNPNYS